ncbi:hypothetical protein Vau01_023380 [Virgisporangium aurantiacum]|uniref:Amino acid adenylation domain-containing protein n=1 Tax=Virgisporangium aurantiacum TaxID=175570 RepID=A0A8J4E0A2_9ACTN|nr:hypothetical protein Vau01_023380 [Virgisporangium aurantiacum]
MRDGGLGSLAATRLWFELRSEFGVDIPVQWLGGGATVADLIARVTAEADGAALTPVPVPVSTVDLGPLTDLQQAYLVAKQGGDDPVGCHVYREFEVDDLDVDRLDAAWRSVVRRHPMLRAVVSPDGQRVADDGEPAPIAVGHDPAEVRERLSHRRYEPGTEPMYTVEVSLRPGRPAVVHLSIDVLIVDGHGLALLLRDWWLFYTDPAYDPPAPVTEPGACLAAIAAERNGPTYRTHLEHWAERLAELPDGPSPALAVTPAASEHVRRRSALTATVSAPQWQRIERFAAACDASPTAVVLTLFAEAFAWQRDPRPASIVLTTSHRGRLPRAADEVVGPFTSSVVLPLDDTLDRPLAEAVTHNHGLLWSALDHAVVSGVTALRRRRGRPARLPVVFTSLLGTGPSSGSGFASQVTYAVSQTTGVSLDHQMWERDGELHVRWDVVDDAFEPGVVRELFAVFVNALNEVTTDEPAYRAMNELQQAYHVPRAVNGPAPWDGCQVYHAFDVTGLDRDRLESAWLRLVAAYDVLRTVVTHDGRLLVSPHVPDRREIPVTDALPAGARERLVSRAFPLGRGPQNDLRVTGETVHVTLDLNIIDGRSIHFLYRELFRVYADPSATPTPSTSDSEHRAARARGDATATAHWRERIAALPSGPRLAQSTDRARTRREGRVTDWAAVRAAAERFGVRTDDLLAAALTEVLAREVPTPFAVPVVRWTDATAALRPGEYTALSWIVREDAGLPLWAQAAAFRAVLDADVPADAVSGLTELRKRVARERRGGQFDLPVVYTGVLDLHAQPLPAGVRIGPWRTCTPDVSLDCVAIEEGDELRYSWDTVDTHFADGVLERAFAGYAEILAGLPADARRRVRIVDEWNDTARAFDGSAPVHVDFEAQARIRPDAVALRWTRAVAPDGSREVATMTYAALNRWANRIARDLTTRGVGPEVGVGVSVPRGPAMVAAVFGILKAGGFYVPLEPGLPGERAATILADSGVALVLTTADRVGWTPAVSTMDLDPADADRPDIGDPAPRTTGDSTAYVIFTSGSTGKPKGVAVAHRPLRNLFAWCARTHGFGPHDVGLCVTSLGFDLSVFDILGLLGLGASLYVADAAEQRDPERLLDLLVHEPVTFWNSAPTTLNQLAPLLPAVTGPGALRLVYLSGDYTPLPLPDEVRAVFTGARIVSLGGATEATVWSNWFDVDVVDPAWRSIPYGRPIDNARYHVLDEHLQPCPPGVEGDLYIGGDCLAIGYHRQPELTAQRFIADPFDRRPGARLYRTGDRALYFDDGVLSFQGRADGQVKIRGFRVELGEIEHRLRAHPAVRDVVALARPDHSGDRKLVAYVVPDGAPPPVGELRRHAAAALPDYMVPNVVAFVDTFPATANGKLDRDALPWPVEPGSSHTLGSVSAPSTPDGVDLTAEIAVIFAELLGVSTVDVHDDVWDLGATSFTMVQVSAALQKRHGQRVPVSVLLADPTVAGIAAAIGGGEPVVDEAATPEPVPDVPPSDVDFFDPGSREAFKSARPDLRIAAPGTPVLPLDGSDVPAVYRDWRASRRRFGDRPLTYAELSALLGLLHETPDRRRLYPSAGDTYAVRVYLHVKPGAVEGLPAGLYYHHPVDHCLHLVDATAAVDRTVHFVYNRPVFDAAGVGIFLFGCLDAIEPLYGADSERFMLLEAGYLGQVLMLGQAATGVALCPIGTVALDPVRAAFGLDDRHRYLHAFLAGPLVPDDTPAPIDAVPPFARPAVTERVIPSGEVAVVGAAGRFPDAPDLDAFWHNLSRGASALRPVPADRTGWPSGAPRPVGGYLDAIDAFDPLLFRIAPVDAADLDPQLRLLLHTVWECLENAGHSPSSVNAAGRVGVFLAAMWNDHQHTGTDGWRAGAPATVSATASDAANRISHAFDFRGPSVAVDTSCSSSLTALHLAVESLRRGECDAAVVAAANLVSHPYHVALLDDLGLLARERPDGAFDATAVGWSPGEGIVALLLRPRAAADRSGETVHALVEASRIGHVGGSGRFGTPDAAALTASMTALLAGAGLTADGIGYVECAAAGAVLADAAEVEALTGVFAGRAAPVPLGTVKPNIGHLEAASGLSQVAKVLLQFRHRQLAPTIVSAQPSPVTDARGTAVAVADTLTHWTPPAGEPLRALVNAVGATGSYGHVVLRSPEPVPADDRPAGPQVVPLPAAGQAQVVPLSAASPAQLAELAGRLRRHLAERRRHRRLPALVDVAHTLRTGRVALAHRAVMVCTGFDDLDAALDGVASGRPHPSTVEGDAARWLAGETVDWSAHPTGRRIPLPTYPFDTGTYGPPPAPVVDTGDRVDYLRGVYAELSGIPVERLDPTVPLDAYGLTSLLITRLNERLIRDLGPVPQTLFFEHRDLAGVASALPSSRPEPARVAVVEPEPEPVMDGDAIAVIGIAGRYPQAPDLDTFWRNLVAGRDVIGPLPEDRHRPEWAGEGMIGGFLDGVYDFDPLFFGITPRDAALMDPQERLFLQTAWHALEDAAHTRRRLRDDYAGRVGVFVGSMYNEYPFFGLDGGPTTGSAVAGIANRVSYLLDVNGPSLTVDTMCSSSITAIHLAVASLRRGECAAAIAGGVNLSLHPNKFRQLRQLRMASTDHRCRSFGAGGDGFVPGEGVGAVVLKPLAAAIAAGDRIQAVIRGTAVNHDGRTNGYTVPNPVAQGDLVAAALRDAGLPAATIGYLEAHGTGTALGDPVEINGLARAFESAGGAPARCAIGSVKSSIGHLEAAAGIAGLTKVVLQFRHRMLAPSIHADDLNPAIDWDAVPFRVQRTAAPWRGVPRRAGISAFGAGGANGHIVVESHVDDPAPGSDGGPVLLVLSARTPAQLRELGGSVADALDTATAPAADIAYTLQVGREAMRERLAVVGDADTVRAALRRAADGDESAVLRGDGTGAAPAPAGAGLDDLALHWVRGGTVDWDALYPVRPRFVALPGYPFARTRCVPPTSSPRTPAAPLSTVEVPLFTSVWEPVTDAAAAPTAGGTVVCLHPPALAGLARAVAAALRPATVVTLDTGDPVAALPAGPVSGWLNLHALADGPAEHDAGPWTAHLAALQDLLRRRPSVLRVLHVTSGLLDLPGTLSGTMAPTTRGARLAGFVRSLGAEHPRVCATVVDVEPGPDLADRIATEWRTADPQGEICVRAGVRYRRRLVPVPASDNVDFRPDPDRVYVVTGGTRGIGALVARHLVDRGARRIAVLGRQTTARVDDLAALGARVMVHNGPLTDRAAVGGFLADVRSRLGALAAVVHCAGRGSLGPAPLAHKSLADVATVFEPKGDGLDVLLDLSATDDLDAVVLFSSVSAAVPALAAGVADYAAANAYLDYAAAHHTAAGRPVRAVDWPVWRDTGGGTARPDAAAPAGLDPIGDREGLAVLDRVLAGVGSATVLPAPGRLDPVTALTVNRPSTVDGPVAPWLLDLFSDLLGIPVPDLDVDATFGDLGVESVLLAELVSRIERRIARPLEPATVLEHPTLRRLNAFLGDTGLEIRAEPARTTVVEPDRDDRRIAVIGVAARMPGAPDVDAFWRLLREGRSGIGEVPAGRWDVDAVYSPEPAPDRSISRWGGFVDGVEDFDPDWFGMTDGQARDLDPAIRLVLEGAATCLADSGYDDIDVRGRDVGVFVGARMSGYRRRIGAAGGLGLGGDQNFIAAMLAHHFDLRGPNLVVDSACSSALVAVRLACASLLSGESEFAFAGGVEVLLDAEPYLEFSAARALSPRGRCATFARDADGFVPGEGCGVLLLKRLDAARRDGDRIRAVIEAVAVGNDGATMGLTTPNPRAQAKVVRDALRLAGRAATDVGMLEAHGTATMIGDPIELRALTDAFREQTDRTGFCAIGSVKSNVGHLLSAAGIAGLVKALLALEHGEIPPTLHCAEPNPRFDFAASPFVPNTALRPWTGPRVAGVSAFGLGGTNAHLIASAYDGGHPVTREPRPRPRFERRRLWHEAAVPAEPAPEPLVASLLELRFEGVR